KTPVRWAKPILWICSQGVLLYVTQNHRPRTGRMAVAGMDCRHSRNPRRRAKSRRRLLTFPPSPRNWEVRPGYGPVIDGGLLLELVAANTGKNAIAFTHKPVLGDEPVAIENRRLLVAAAKTASRSISRPTPPAHADRLAAPVP